MKRVKIVEKTAQVKKTVHNSLQKTIECVIFLSFYRMCHILYIYSQKPCIHGCTSTYKWSAMKPFSKRLKN